MDDRVSDKFRQYEIAEIAAESETISSFYLRPVEGEVPAVVPGEHLIVEVPAGPNGRGVRREYSVSGLDSMTLRLTIKREPPPASNPQAPPGVVSNYFHDVLRVGDRISASQPRGLFRLDRDSSAPVVLLSGGVGLTPMVAMARELAGKGRATYYIHACENGRVHAMGRELSELASKCTNLKVHTCYRVPDPQDVLGEHYDTAGLVTREILQEVAALKDAFFYVCGPSAFMQAMYDMLHELEVPVDRIKYEFFGPATVLRPSSGTTQRSSVDKRNAAEGSPRVTFVKSGITAEWNPTYGSLLEFAEEQGLSPNFSCRSGSCESCAARLLSGEIEYVVEPFELPPDGAILLCCSQPKSDVAIDV